MKKYLGTIITFLVGGIVALIILSSKGIFMVDNVKDVYHILTDAFFTPGVILLCFGLLIVATDGGAFDMLRYGTMRFFSLFRRDPQDVKFKTYFEYVSEKHKEHHNFWYLVGVGVFYIVISLIFTYLWYQC